MQLNTLFKSAALACLWLLPNSGDAQLKNVNLNGPEPCSVKLINDNITEFYANKKLMGLNQYNDKGELLKANAGGENLKFDYVPGLVAKAIIEAASYYSDKDFARSWFYSVQDYANRCIDEVPIIGKSLDDLNATKMYFELYNLTDPEKGAFRDIADPQTHANAERAMKNAVLGLKDAMQQYVITPDVNATYAGGWWHKISYPQQMWCDGQYMGPALLAQLVHYGYTVDGAEADWKTITRQFDITWSKLWNPEKRLLRHAFSAAPQDEKSRLWADPETGLSQEYWGRACGWYFLALIDVLELIPSGIEMEATLPGLEVYSSDCRARLFHYLNQMADGLARWQDKESHCWYQLLAHDGNFTVKEYQGKKFEPTKNYLESSASCLFTAGFLKAMRLRLLPESYRQMANEAYRGLYEQFVAPQADGRWMLIQDCASAGLGGASWGVRDGSAAYYLLGSDVTRITNYTEGKVYGAFILAAVEWERSQVK